VTSELDGILHLSAAFGTKFFGVVVASDEAATSTALVRQAERDDAIDPSLLIS